jgi:hypothetical protein
LEIFGAPDGIASARIRGHLTPLRVQYAATVSKEMAKRSYDFEPCWVRMKQSCH